MKIRYAFFILAILIFGAVTYMFISYVHTAASPFCMNDYQCYIEKYSSDRVLGKVISAKDAQNKAERIWLEVYGNSVLEKKPYQVFFDAGCKAWLVCGTQPSSYWFGGVPYLILDAETGTVLAVWHDM